MGNARKQIWRDHDEPFDQLCSCFIFDGIPGGRWRGGMVEKLKVERWKAEMGKET